MLRTVLIGPREFDFAQVLAHWLANRSNLVGAVWTDATAWQSSWTSRVQFVQRRLKRYGPIKVLDEAMMFAWYRAFGLSRDVRNLQDRITNPYWARHGSQRWTGDAIATDDVNAPAVLQFLSSHQPDAIFSVCILNYFGQDIRGIPRLGIFLWHDGITPEYRGVYSPFWAIHNLDWANVGCSLLRINATLDGGDVYVQSSASEVDYRRQGHAYIGHKAIADSLPGVERLLRELEQGTARPLDRSTSIPCYYTYPGFSDLIRQRWRLAVHESRRRASSAG
jgi:hypothetical protein